MNVAAATLLKRRSSSSDMAVDIIVGVAWAEAATAALSSLQPLHPIAFFTC